MKTKIYSRQVVSIDPTLTIEESNFKYIVELYTQPRMDHLKMRLYAAWIVVRDKIQLTRLLCWFHDQRWYPEGPDSQDAWLNANLKGSLTLHSMEYHNSVTLGQFTLDKDVWESL